MTGDDRYRVPLDELERSSHVPAAALVQEQPVRRPLDLVSADEQDLTRRLADPGYAGRLDPR